MDLQDIWQEHRRFILGVGIGLLAFLILGWISEKVLGKEEALRAPRRTSLTMQRSERYDKDARTSARRLNASLQERAAELRGATAFLPRDEFLLEGKGDHEIYFPGVARRVRNDVLRAAQEQGIELLDTDLEWEPPVGLEQTADTLVGLDALEVAAKRLFAASAEVVARDPEALGVQSVERLQYRPQGKSRPGLRRPGGRSRKVSADDGQVREHRVNFEFRADIMTVQTWLEALRGATPPLALDADLTIKTGDQIGDPVQVIGTLLALTVQES